jgi:hypothetical protein
MKDFMTGEPLHTLFVHSVFYLTDLLLRVDGSVAAVLLVLMSVLTVRLLRLFRKPSRHDVHGRARDFAACGK